jgi:2-haloacid dehalogenase
MTKINTIIFDLGGVLIDWNPDYLYKKLIPDTTERKWFLDNICTSEWNEEQDGGRLIADANSLLINRYPSYKSLIEAFYDRWEEMLGGSIAETVSIFDNLRKTGNFKFYALTNWSAETFPKALTLFEFLHWFDGRLVSGEEMTRKPFDDFYERLITKFSIDKSSAIFIDDNYRNVVAAERLGIKSYHFTSAADLKNELTAMGLLPE